MLGDLLGTYEPDADVSESLVEWLVAVALDAGFGDRAVALSLDGGLAAFGVLESIVREPWFLQAHVSRCVSRLRYPARDFVVEFRTDDGTAVACGASPTLSLAIMHAARTLARST